MDGGRVFDELLADNHERIAGYCQRDMKAVMKAVSAVYYRMCYEATPPGTPGPRVRGSTLSVGGGPWS